MNQKTIKNAPKNDQKIHQKMIKNAQKNDDYFIENHSL
jgi:hypothetical protein